MNKTYLVIDAQGGKMGASIINAIKQKYNDSYVIAVGTNSIATSSMFKSNPDICATGENSVIVAARKADVIIGPIGIVIADSMMGEITEKMAVAVGKSDAKKILLPYNKCDIYVAGIKDLSLSSLLEDIKNII